MRHLLIAVLSAVFASACSGGGGSTCVPGASSACTCTNGSSGAQICLDDHTFGACTCDGGGAGGGTQSGSGGGTQSGSGGGTSSGGMKRIFLTTTSHDGNFGGLSGADTFCNTAAQAGTLGGTWKAWLSDDSTNALDRIQDVGPWYSLGLGGKVFNNKANLTTQPLESITISEQGVNLYNGPHIFVWTGTALGGMRSSSGTCSGWTSTSGQTAAGYADTTDQWTEVGPEDCFQSFRLYCIEQ